MRYFTTETEARAAIKEVVKQYPGCEVNEVHVDSPTDHNWYVFVVRRTSEGGKEMLFRCKWSSPIIQFK